MPKHVHCELIKSWADGAEIQFKTSEGRWIDIEPAWNPVHEYRVKPRLVKRYGWVNLYKRSFRHVTGGYVYDCKENAARVAHADCVATVKVEWEEEQ